jgi:hypothetical protein
MLPSLGPDNNTRQSNLSCHFTWRRLSSVPMLWQSVLIHHGALCFGQYFVLVVLIVRFVLYSSVLFFCRLTAKVMYNPSAYLTLSDWITYCSMEQYYHADRCTILPLIWKIILLALPVKQQVTEKTLSLWVESKDVTNEYLKTQLLLTNLHS